MPNKIIVQCSNNHSFPVNMNKHTNRTYVICPHARCYEQVKIRKRRFPFSKTWEKQREQQRQLRLFVKERGRRPRPAMAFQSLRARGMAGILAFSRLIRKREDEAERD